MKSICWIYILFILNAIILTNGLCSAKSASSNQPQQTIGIYCSPDNSYKAIIAVSSMGGFKTCQIMNAQKKIHSINDITGLIWLNGTKTIYSVSPAYGKPGVFIYDCKSMKEETIIPPQNLNHAYPNGADYFELEKYNSKKEEIHYYYAYDIDSVDFKKFRIKKNILTKRIK
jgi:hypothetical protein